MFSVKENECVGFESIWKVKRVYTEGTSQTSEYFTANTSTNTSTVNEIETQTENDRTTPSVDMQRLANWLNQIYPQVDKELNKSVTSKAFCSEHYLFKESDVADAKLIQTLNVTADTGDGDLAFNVNGLSWNATGNTLAVTCNHFHKTWCHHSGRICLYTLDRNGQLPALPHKKLHTTACVTALQFHPTLPSVIGSGLHSGEIIIWNTQHDDGDNVVVKVNGHEERVTHLLWVHDVDAAKWLLLATSSLDGLLNLWTFSLPSAILKIKEKYKIKSPVLSKVQGSITSGSEGISKKIIRGILSFDFSPYIPDMFVVGIEGGLIVQCSMLCSNQLKGSTKEVPVSDPVFKYYEPHEGEINVIRFSPNRREMFLTNGSDGEIRIYLIDQESPARIIFLEKLLNYVSWVPFQEKLVTGCGEEGVLKMFHLINGKTIQNITSEKIVQNNLLSLQINKQRCTTVVAGNDKGEIQLWNVPWGAFASQTP